MWRGRPGRGMVRGIFAASVIASLLGAGAASADEHLVPEGKFDQVYQDTAKSVFRVAFEPTVLARAIIEPSFWSEFAVGVRLTAGQYSVFALTPSKQIWNGSLEKAEQTEPKTVHVAACEIPVEQSDGVRMVAVWKNALARVQANSAVLGNDGETDHYSMTVNGKELAGQAWSPREDSEAGMMRDIAYAIHDACEKNDHRELTKMKPLLGKLAKLSPQ
jgi:hypothetical protein